mgnify:CR=1 FL=1
MSAYVVSRTVEVSASGRRTVHTTAEAPTMNEALAMMQDLILMKGAGIESTAALVSIADGDDAQG